MTGIELTDSCGEHQIAINGSSTRYLEAGDHSLPTMLLLHDGAWGGASDVTWGRCIPYLSEHFHVIAPDFLGFGGSDKVTYFDRSSYDPRIRQIVGLLDALDVAAPIHVVGSSFGGSVVLRMIEQEAYPLQSAVSIGGSGGKWKTQLMTDELGRWDGTRDDLARVVKLLAAEDGAFGSQLELRLRWASQPGHYRAVASAAMPVPANLKSAIHDDWPHGLAGKATPTLLIAGVRDQLFDPEWPDAVAAGMANAVVQKIDTLHSPNLDHPKVISRMLIEFAEQNGT
jgi:pimeloyl-ACP methyl ester carboxylesterase